MPRMAYIYLQMPIGWNGLGMCLPFGQVYVKARSVKKESVPDMIHVKLTYVPVKIWIVYPDVKGPTLWNQLTRAHQKNKRLYNIQKASKNLLLKKDISLNQCQMLSAVDKTYCFPSELYKFAFIIIIGHRGDINGPGGKGTGST